MLAITDAAFIGFRIARQKPLTVLWWAGFYFIFTLATTVLTVLTVGPELMELQNLDPSSSADPMETLGLVGKVAPMIFVLLLLSAIYYGIVQGAANRAVLEPGEERNGYLRFGAQEWRQTLLVLLLWAIFFGAYLVLGIGVVLAVVLASLAHVALGVLVGALLIPALLLGLIALGVKLSMASPIAYATGKIDFGASWRMSKGHFWPMFGTYALAGIMAVVVSLLAMAIFFVVAFLSGGMEVVGRVMEPDVSTLGNIFTPFQIAYYVFAAVVSSATMLIWICPLPEVYRQLTTEAPAQV